MSQPADTDNAAAVPPRPLVSLEEHNRRAWERAQEGLASKPRRNGIECPHCGGELVDTEPHVILCSYPGQKRVACVACGFHGLRNV